MKELITVAHAFADETRWRIIQLVAEEALCVCEIADILDMPQSSVSSHLQVIKKADLLDSEKCEKWIYYRLARRHQKMVTTMGSLFNALPSDHPVLKSDARRAEKRLNERDKSCCPPPSTLARGKSQTPTKQKSSIILAHHESH